MLLAYGDLLDRTRLAVHSKMGTKFQQHPHGTILPDSSLEFSTYQTGLKNSRLQLYVLGLAINALLGAVIVLLVVTTLRDHRDVDDALAWSVDSYSA